MSFADLTDADESPGARAAAGARAAWRAELLEEARDRTRAAPSVCPGVPGQPSDSLAESDPVSGSAGGHAGDPSSLGVSSPPPVLGVSSLPVGEREGGDFASGPASRLPDLSTEGPGSADDLRLRLEIAELEGELETVGLRAATLQAELESERRARIEAEIKLQVAKTLHEARERLWSQVLDEGAEHGIPGRDYPLEVRLGGLVTLFRRTTRQRRS